MSAPWWLKIAALGISRSLAVGVNNNQVFNGKASGRATCETISQRSSGQHHAARTAAPRYTNCKPYSSYIPRTHSSSNSTRLEKQRKCSMPPDAQVGARACTIKSCSSLAEALPISGSSCSSDMVQRFCTAIFLRRFRWGRHSPAASLRRPAPLECCVM